MHGRIALDDAFAQQKTQKTLNGRELAADRTLFVAAVQHGEERVDVVMVDIPDRDGTGLRPLMRFFHEGKKLQEIT